LIRTLVVNEPNATELLMTASDGAGLMKDFGNRFASSREAFRNRDFERALPLFANAVGGPGTCDRRSEAERQMIEALAFLAKH
jgi:non-heme chloroperoxidase